MSEEMNIDLKETSKDCVQMKDEMAMNCYQLEDIQLKSDEELAKEMQLQYDKEYGILKYIEEKSRGSSIRSPDVEEDMFDKYSSEDESCDETDRFDAILNNYDAVPAFNYKNKDIRKVCEDNAGLRIKKYDRTLNCSYEMCIKQKPPYKQQIFDRCITVSYGIDDIMRRVLYRLMDQEIIAEVNDVIYIGKNTVILHMKTVPQDGLPSECAIMMFKSALPKHKKPGRRLTQKMMRFLAEKELQHLERLRRAGVLCPTVLGLKGPTLVISFLGRNCKSAPNLKDATISDMKMTVAYSQVVHYLHVMYKECKLIHGDLSANNLLWFDNNCYMIDVSQCVETTHENAFHLLYKDCESVSKIFSKRNVPDVATPDELFKDVTGCAYADINLTKGSSTNVTE